MKRRLVWVVSLAIAVLASGVTTVYVKHQSRKQFSKLQQQLASRDELNIEWSRLLLEQGTWATHSRVEELARDRLQMELPEMRTIVIVQSAH